MIQVRSRLFHSTLVFPRKSARWCLYPDLEFHIGEVCIATLNPIGPPLSNILVDTFRGVVPLPAWEDKG